MDCEQIFYNAIISECISERTEEKDYGCDHSLNRHEHILGARILLTIRNVEKSMPGSYLLMQEGAHTGERDRQRDTERDCINIHNVVNLCISQLSLNT